MEPPVETPPMPDAEQPVATPTTRPPDLPPPPDQANDGYSWDALARMAAANSTAAQLLQMEAREERLDAIAGTTWRDPQFKIGRFWGDQDTRTWNRRGWADRSSHGETAALRVYTTNPFVSRWLRRRGESAARAKEAEAKEMAFIVFCEVRTLCLEAEMLREEEELLERQAETREQLREVLREKAEAGVGKPLDAIRAETRVSTLRMDIRERQMARRQCLRRIATLTGLPLEHVKLSPRDAAGTTLPTALLDETVLTDLALSRRPDLERAMRERETAAHEVKAAEAGRIPWLEYIEGSYDDERSRTWDHEPLALTEKSTRDETEWEVRLAVTVPVFSWMGNEVKLSRQRLAMAETQMQGFHKQVRDEVSGALLDYREAHETFTHLQTECKAFCDRAAATLRELAKETAIQQEDLLAVREELVSYRRACLKAERECLLLAQYLETVSGGPLSGDKQ